MFKRERVFLLISLALHLGLLFSAYKYVSWLPVEVQKTSFVEFRGDRVSETYKSVMRHQAAAKARVLRKSKRIARAKLDLAVQRVLRNSVAGYGQGSSGLALEEFDGGGEDGQTVDGKSYHRLWSQIRSHVSYLEEHRLLRLSGHVQISVRVDEYGKIQRILEETATGDRRLVGWVLLCLMEALKESVPEVEMGSKKLLELHFYFTLGDKTPEVAHSNKRMYFSIVGEKSDGILNQLARGQVPDPNLARDQNPNRLFPPSPDQVALLTIPTDRIVDLFKKKKSKNNIEMSFYEKEAKYKHHCDNAYNPDACESLAKMYEAMGDFDKAKKMRNMEEAWLERERQNGDSK